MKIYKSKVRIISVVLAIFVIVAAMLCIAAMNNDNDENESTFLSLVERLDSIMLVNPVVSIDLGHPEALTAEEKDQVRKEFCAAMDEALTSDSYLRNTYNRIFEGRLPDKVQCANVNSGYGVFSSEIISKSYDGDVAKARIESVTWSKYISQGSVDSEYSVVFPVNKDITDIVFKKENGEWKIESYEILEHLMEGDYDLALEYSKSVMPKNVFAK